MFMRRMNIFRPRTRNQWVVAGTTILLLLVVVGVILFQSVPAVKGWLGCVVGCEATDPNIYLASARSTDTNTSASTSLYTIDAQTGNVQQATYLESMGNIYYQKVINGIDYMLVDFSPIGVATNATSLVAVRLRDGKFLWDFYEVNIDANILATATMLYLPVYSALEIGPVGVVALQIPSGRVAWRYTFAQTSGNPASSQIPPSILLEGNTLLATWADTLSSERMVALHADSGRGAWMHTFTGGNTSGGFISPILDAGRIFIALASDVAASPAMPNQPTENIFALDLNKGTQLWQGKLVANEPIATLHIVNHCLFMETTNRSLYAFQESSPSLIWSYIPSAAGEPEQTQWMYTDTTVYGLIYVVNAHTFALKRIVSAWQFPQGRQLFQTDVGLSGNIQFFACQQYLLLFYSTNATAASTEYPKNDVEALQAQTGAVLWHDHVGKLPPLTNYAKNYVFWNQSLLASDMVQSDPFDVAHYHPNDSIPDNAPQHQTVLFFLNDQMDYQYTHTTVLYGIDWQSGQVLWGKNVKQLDTDPSLHPTPTPTPRIFTTYPAPKSAHDFTNFVGTWVSHIGDFVVAKDGKATSTVNCRDEQGCPTEWDISQIQFTRVHGTTAYGRVISTNFQPNQDGFVPGTAITAQLGTDGTLNLSPQRLTFCDSQAAGEYICGN